MFKAWRFVVVSAFLACSETSQSHGGGTPQEGIPDAQGSAGAASTAEGGGGGPPGTDAAAFADAPIAVQSGGSGGASASSHTEDAAPASGGNGGAPLDSGGPLPDIGSGACNDFTPCGGSLVGSWNYTTCSDPVLQGLSLLCADVQETVSIEGGMEFRQDGTMSSSLVVHTQATVGASCVAPLGGCGANFGVLTQCTSGPAGTCVCDTANDNGTSDATYSTEGNVLTTVRNGQPDYSYYCRQGDEVWARGVSAQGEIYVFHLTPR